MKYIVLFNWRRGTRSEAESFFISVFGEVAARKNMKHGYVLLDSKEEAATLLMHMNNVRCMKVAKFVFTASVWERVSI